MEKYDSTHTKDELMQQLNDISNDFSSHDVNSYDNHAPISYHDNEPNTSVATPPSRDCNPVLTETEKPGKPAIFAKPKTGFLLLPNPVFRF